MSDYNVFVLPPLEAKSISIKAISFIAFDILIKSKNGVNEINASEKFITLGTILEGSPSSNYSGKNGVFLREVIKDRLEMILGKFEKGISNQDGQIIVDALLETFEAINDSFESEEERIDISNTFEFFPPNQRINF